MPRPYVSGKDLEERLRTKLETLCNIQYDQVFDHDFKLDFIVTSFKGIPRFTQQIGVQVTARTNDIAKQQEFLQLQRAHTPTPRAAYIELDQAVNVDGAAQVAYAGLVSLVLDRSREGDRIVGLRIAKDFSFEFFDLAVNTQTQPPRQNEQGLSTVIAGQASEGKIVQYGHRGFGYITTATRSERFWFHFESVDAQVKNLLDNLLANSTQETLWGLSIPVTFEDGGYTRQDVKNPTAINVYLRTEEHPQDETRKSA